MGVWLGDPGHHEGTLHIARQFESLLEPLGSIPIPKDSNPWLAVRVAPGRVSIYHRKLPRESNPVPTLRPDVEWIDPESGSHGVFGGAYFAFNLEDISHCTVPIVTV